MSPFPDRPSGFLEWVKSLRDHPLLETNSPSATSFLPRALFGEYIAREFDSAVRTASHHRVERIADKVINLTLNGEVWTARGTFGSRQGDRVVLALGNPPPTLLPTLQNVAPDRILNPWQSLEIRKEELGNSVICIGTGLTAVDVAVKLAEIGYAGTIHFISRHGLLPLSHLEDPLIPTKSKLELSSKGLRLRVQELIRKVKEGIENGDPWQATFDTLRPHHQALWTSLSEREQRQFIRHVGVYWEIHRHRVAPELAGLMRSLQHSNRLKIHKGSLVSAGSYQDHVTVQFRQRGSQVKKAVTGSHIFLCTGPARNIAAWENPIVDDLVRDAFIQSDPLRIGFKATTKGDRAGLKIIGTALRGILWETTAVREIALQATDIAAAI